MVSFMTHVSLSGHGYTMEMVMLLWMVMKMVMLMVMMVMMVRRRFVFHSAHESRRLRSLSRHTRENGSATSKTR